VKRPPLGGYRPEARVAVVVPEVIRWRLAGRQARSAAEEISEPEVQRGFTIIPGVSGRRRAFEARGEGGGRRHPEGRRAGEALQPLSAPWPARALTSAMSPFGRPFGPRASLVTSGAQVSLDAGEHGVTDKIFGSPESKGFGERRRARRPLSASPGRCGSRRRR